MSFLFGRFGTITNTVNSVFNGQRFVVTRARPVETDGEPAFNISNDLVRIFNFAEIASVNSPVTIDISGENATVFNSRIGTISADGGEGINGVAIDITGSARVFNFGEITSDFTSVDFSGADVSGRVFNASRAVISSDSRAVNIDGEGVRVDNFGLIVGTDNQRNGTVYADSTAQNFTVNNIRSGVIDAGESNEGSGVGVEIAAEGNSFEINNSGTIQGRGNASAAVNGAGDGIRIGNVGNIGVADAEINNIGEILSEGANGTVAGIRFVNGISFQGELNNAGTIAGVQNGVYFGNPVDGQGGDHSGGVVNNTGTISSDSRAFNLDGIGLTVNNAGDIVGTASQRNGTFYADGGADDFTVNNLSNGVIDAGEGNEGSGFGAEIGGAVDGANTFELNNAGTIQGRGNASAATNAAGDGVRLGNVGNIGVVEAEINNSGSILSEGANGTVAGLRVVNGISFQGELNNSGTIAGVQNGVYFGNPVDGQGGDHSGGVVNNTGTISSDSRAFNLDGIGLTVNNAGDIVGTASQRNGTFYADGGADDFTVNNLETGVIDAGEGNEGSGFGAEIGGAVDGANTFELNNAGTIQGRGNASAATNAAGDGVRLGNVGNIGVVEAEINNSGSILSEGANGTVAGLRVVNGISFQGELNNSGTIAGVQNGLYFGNAVDGQGAIHTGVVNNTGVISSDSRALNIDGTGLTVNNSGQIIGTASQRNGTVYADQTAQDFVLNNLETGVIDAGEGNLGAGFAVELEEEALGGNNFTINNDGLIQGRGSDTATATTAGDGIRFERTRVPEADLNGLAGDTTGLFTGVVNNTGIIASESTNGTTAGLHFINGTSFSGEINNSGTISGVQNGVYFGNPTPAGGGNFTDGVFNNLEGGIVSSDSRAFNLDGFGLTVNNAGSIIGTASQRNGTFYADGTADDYTVNNQLTGLIDAGEGNEGSGFGVEVGGAADGATTFDLVNAGRIQGRGNGAAGTNAAGDGVRIGNVGNTGVVDGTIVNDGIIDSEGANGTVAGVRFVNGISFQGELINNGTISGVQNGLYFGNAVEGGPADHTGSFVLNNGIISSGSRALNIDGTGLTIVNEGDIVGTGDQRNGTVYTDATADEFVFVNGVNGVVDAGLGNNGSAVSLQTGEAVVSVVVNQGLFQGQGTADSANGIGHGLRLFPGAGELSSNDGIILNTGDINGAEANLLADGVSIEGVALNGVLANFGEINAGGSGVAIDAAASNGVNIVNAGEINGDVLLSTEADDTFVFVNGGNIDGIVDAGTAADGNDEDTLVLVGFSAEEEAAILEQFQGFENVVSLEDAFDETLSALSSDASIGDLVATLAAEADGFTEADLLSATDELFTPLTDTSAGDALFA